MHRYFNFFFRFFRYTNRFLKNQKCEKTEMFLSLFKFFIFHIFEFKLKTFTPWVWSQARGFGYEESFNGNEDDSIIQPQLNPNGVKLGLMAQSLIFFFFFNLNLCRGIRICLKYTDSSHRQPLYQVLPEAR